MAMLVLLCLVLEGEGAWEIRDTEIFQPLRTDEVIVTADGEVFILNFRASQVEHFDRKGQKVGTIGFKGQGPGGLTYPVNFFLEGDHLFVLDMLNSSISVFQSKDGVFQKRFRLPQRNLAVAKVPDGWIYGDWGGAENPGESAHLYWADSEFENSQLLYKLHSSGYSGGMSLEEQNGEVRAVFTPLSSQPHLLVSGDGALAFLSEPEGFEIQVIDVARHKVVYTIHRQDAPIPFDEDWGLERRAEIDKMRPQTERQVKFQNHFPQFFPVIRDMRLDTKGHLVVDKWMGRPDKRHNLVALDRKGKQMEPSHDWEVLSRLVAVRGSWAYVTIFDNENEEAGLGRCPLASVDRFVEDNPIVFEGMAGRMIQIED